MTQTIITLNLYNSKRILKFLQSFGDLHNFCTPRFCNLHTQDLLFCIEKEPIGKNIQKSEGRDCMKRFFPRTDLASERMRADTDIGGVSLKKSNDGDIETEVLTVSSDEGALSIGKPKGVYTTFFFPSPAEMNGDTKKLLIKALGDSIEATLLRLSGKPRISELSLLVAGLGNRNLTVDSVGVATAEKIHATAHIKEELPTLFHSLGAANICVALPGVLSQSGIEAADAIAGLLKSFPADAVLVFDALAARSLSRVGKTVQIADSGIEPGSGIGNRRRALSLRTLGVPVVSVGVPTVTDTATLVSDTLVSLMGEALPESVGKLLSEAEKSFVSPDDCDRVTEEISKILADTVNRRLGVVL